MVYACLNCDDRVLLVWIVMLGELVPAHRLLTKLKRNWNFVTLGSFSPPRWYLSFWNVNSNICTLGELLPARMELLPAKRLFTILKWKFLCLYSWGSCCPPRWSFCPPIEYLPFWNENPYVCTLGELLPAKVELLPAKRLFTILKWKSLCLYSWGDFACQNSTC